MPFPGCLQTPLRRFWPRLSRLSRAGFSDGLHPRAFSDFALLFGLAKRRGPVLSGSCLGLQLARRETAAPGAQPHAARRLSGSVTCAHAPQPRVPTTPALLGPQGAEEDRSWASQLTQPQRPEGKPRRRAEERAEGRQSSGRARLPGSPRAAPGGCATNARLNQAKLALRKERAPRSSREIPFVSCKQQGPNGKPAASAALPAALSPRLPRGTPQGRGTSFGAGAGQWGSTASRSTARSAAARPLGLHLARPQALPTGPLSSGEPCSRVVGGARRRRRGAAVSPPPPPAESPRAQGPRATGCCR